MGAGVAGLAAARHAPCCNFVIASEPSLNVPAVVDGAALACNRYGHLAGECP